jgi:hypothetical protein
MKSAEHTKFHRKSGMRGTHPLLRIQLSKVEIRVGKEAG